MKLQAIAFVGIALFACANAVPAIGSLGGICSYYSGVLGYNNSFLISTVVGDVVTTAVSAGSPIKQYFDGTTPPGSRNFLAPNETAALNTLFLHLVQFFGGVLNCTDGTITTYAGKSMAAAHANMKTTFYAFSVFNNAVVSSLLKFGVNATDANLVASALNGVRDACSATDCNTICNRYTIPAIASNSVLVGAVVDGTVNAALNVNSGLRQFFNGSVPAGSIDFTTNTAQYTRLRTNLVNFFGQALGCSDMSIPAYTGKNMKLAHATIPIGNTAFVTFNTALVGVMKGAGVAQADLMAVAGVLEGTRADICNQPDCFPTTAAATTAQATTGALISAPSSASIFAPAFFLFALLAALF